MARDVTIAFMFIRSRCTWLMLVGSWWCASLLRFQTPPPLFFFETGQKICHFHSIRRYRGFGHRPNYNTLLSRHHITKKFSSRKTPQLRLIFNSSNKNPYRHRGVAEDSSIPLLPNFPRDKHNERHHRPPGLRHEYNLKIREHTENQDEEHASKDRRITSQIAI